MYKESKVRSMIKTISWRIWATLTTMILVFIFTGKVAIAATVGGVEVVVKMLLYFIHERAWGRINAGKKTKKSAVVWFTGLSGSGKSTIAGSLYNSLQKRGLKVEHLDGDTVRDIFPQTGFSKEARDQHIKRVGYLASRLEQNGVFVIASFISPYEEARNCVRNLCDNFIEVHVSTPLEECEKRDVKGLYAKARKGEIKCFTGIDDPYEAPLNPEIAIDTSNVSVDEACTRILNHIK